MFRFWLGGLKVKGANCVGSSTCWMFRAPGRYTTGKPWGCGFGASRQGCGRCSRLRQLSCACRPPGRHPKARRKPRSKRHRPQRLSVCPHRHRLQRLSWPPRRRRRRRPYRPPWWGGRARRLGKGSQRGPPWVRRLPWPPLCQRVARCQPQRQPPPLCSGNGPNGCACKPVGRCRRLTRQRHQVARGYRCLTHGRARLCCVPINWMPARSARPCSRHLAFGRPWWRVRAKALLQKTPQVPLRAKPASRGDNANGCLVCR